MNHSIKTGFSFGLTSAIITTLGLMVGLHAGTSSRLVVIGGILIIAIADALSDALGIHVSEESENKHTAKEIWQSTVSTFITKFAIAITFIVPILLFELPIAIAISVIWGLFLLSVYSYRIGKKGKRRFRVVGEHLFIAVAVIVITHYIGVWISLVFG